MVVVRNRLAARHSLGCGAGAGRTATRQGASARFISAVVFPEAGVGLRELTTNNAGVCAAIDKIYTEFELAPERAQGLVPLVEVVDTVTSESNFGTIFDPVFAIVGWRPRPHELTPPPPPSTAPKPKLAALALGHDDDLNDKIPF